MFLIGDEHINLRNTETTTIFKVGFILIRVLVYLEPVPETLGLHPGWAASLSQGTHTLHGQFPYWIKKK